MHVSMHLDAFLSPIIKERKGKFLQKFILNKKFLDLGLFDQIVGKLSTAEFNSQIQKLLPAVMILVVITEHAVA